MEEEKKKEEEVKEFHKDCWNLSTSVRLFREKWDKVLSEKFKENLRSIEDNLKIYGTYTSKEHFNFNELKDFINKIKKMGEVV